VRSGDTGDTGDLGNTGNTGETGAPSCGTAGWNDITPGDVGCEMYPTLPEPESDVQLSYVSLSTATGDVTALLSRPTAPGTYPAIVVGAEAWGLTSEMVDVARRLAGQGYVTITPDYLRGEGFGDADHDDMPRLMRLIDSLDFRRASDDLFAGASYLAGLDVVDRTRIGTWGYCTGATMSMLFACLSRDVRAAVLFYPSQPVFASREPRRPVDPMDLIWNSHAPALVVYGDQDPIMPPPLLAELRRRIEDWQVDWQIKIYPGVTHAFCSMRKKRVREK